MRFEMEQIVKKAEEGLRLSRQDLAALYLEAPLPLLECLATNSRDKRHTPGEVTYLKMAIINYTNICVAKCSYCAFYRLPHESGTYLLTLPEIFGRIDQAMELGVRMVGFNGGFHPKLTIPDYAKMFAAIRERYGETLEFYGMTVAEMMFAARVSRLSYPDAVDLLRESGSRWITGGGAEILDDAFRRKHSPGKFLVSDYFKAQQSILEGGLGSTATMVIGFGETLEQRLNHLESLRTFQDDTGRVMPSFLCWTYKPYHTDLGGTEVSDEEYWRWLALCRLYLDNFLHIRTSVLTKNAAALTGLKYGANDFDLPTEDEVTQKAGAEINRNFDEILDSVESLGFRAVLRSPFNRRSEESHEYTRRPSQRHPLTSP